ncbi:MAG: flagellar hook protein FlgE [Chromatiales bacterium]|jgi:flagellar hook protein FlgE|nr:flagellar hook protein FlgE [Chromatiales bacterium]
MAFRIALTGLAAAAADLSVTADNIANTNTTGFKGSRTEFADIVQGAGRAVGTNTIGSGVQLAAITQQFDQGNIFFTGNPLDLAIGGQGFFRVNDAGSTSYTRAGGFQTDRDGFVVNSLNQRLTGFGADATGAITGTLTDLSVDTADVPPRITSDVGLSANLDASATAPTAAFDPTNPASFNDSTSVTFFDSLGDSHTANMIFRKTAANAWEHYLTVDGTQIGGAQALTFDTSGSLTAPAAGAFSAGPFTPALGTAAQTLNFDFNSVTQFGSQFGVNFLTQDGFPSGSLSGIQIEENGVLFGRYSNGESLALGQVALANFSNVQGLTRVGEKNWAESFASGPPLVGAPNSSTLGGISSGALEDSNVELTEQLVNIINAQRNFQANAQVITASDTLKQTILNIIR